MQTESARKQMLEARLHTLESEMQRLTTIESNFAKEMEGVKDKPALVQALKVKAQPFSNRLTTVQEQAYKVQQELEKL